MAHRRDILLISSNFPPVVGGSSMVYDQICRNAADQVVALGANCDYVTGRRWSEPDLAADRERPYLIHRISVLRPPLSQSGQSVTAKLKSDDFIVMASVLLTVIRLWWRYRFKTVCIGELIYGGWLVFPLRYLLGRRVILYTHGEEVAQDPDSRLAHLRRSFLHHAHAIIAVSQFCKGQIIAKYGVPPDRIALVANGVDLSVFKPGDADPDSLPAAAKGRRIILSVSRLVKRKGHAALIAALPAILERHPDAHCLIVGEGPEAATLRQMIDQLGLDQGCTMMGGQPIASLVGLYRQSEVLALPCQTQPDGDTEGFGLVFLEANACGLAVVGGAAGGTIEAVIDGENGLIVDGSQPTDIAAAINRLLDDRQLAARLAENGARRALAMGWSHAAGYFLDICLNPGTSPPPAFVRPIAAGGGAPPRLLVTVDVEEQFDWGQFSRTDYRIPDCGALRIFHQEHQAIGVKPVYLLTYPMLTDPAYQEFGREILADGSGELGIHLHGWITPPFWEFPNVFSSYQCNLPEYLERQKLQVLCAAFEQAFGQKARIHRAGRWGGNDRTAGLLSELGIDIDLSASAGFAGNQEGSPDFSNLTGEPFWTDDDHRVLSIPASSMRYGLGPHWVSLLLTKLMPALSRRFSKPVRLSPEGEEERLTAGMIREIARRGQSVAVFSLHGTSLLDDGNPYSIGAGRAAALRRRSVTLLEEAIRAGWLRPSSCAEIWQDESARRDRERLSHD